VSCVVEKDEYRDEKGRERTLAFDWSEAEGSTGFHTRGTSTRQKRPDGISAVWKRLSVRELSQESVHLESIKSLNHGGAIFKIVMI
jgi:hypothetical protein